MGSIPFKILADTGTLCPNSPNSLNTLHIVAKNNENYSDCFKCENISFRTWNNLNKVDNDVVKHCIVILSCLPRTLLGANNYREIIIRRSIRFLFCSPDSTEHRNWTNF